MRRRGPRRIAIVSGVLLLSAVALYLWNREPAAPLSVVIVAKPHATNNFQFSVLVTNRTRHHYDFVVTSKGMDDSLYLEVGGHSGSIIEAPHRKGEGAQTLAIIYIRTDSRLRDWINDVLKFFHLEPFYAKARILKHELVP